MALDNAVMEVVKSFILREFLSDEDPNKLTHTTPLMSSGILDSIAWLKLIVFLETEFNVQVEAHEADEEHLNTLEAICDLVDSKRKL